MKRMHQQWDSLRALKVSFVLCFLCAVMARGFDSVVVFNELQYNPGAAGEEGEWVEIHNQNAVDVDISNWRISGGVEFTFPGSTGIGPRVNTIIPGKGYIVVARSPAMSGVPGAMGPWTGALNNTGETLRLRDNNDRIMDELTYGDKGDWPIPPDGSGATLAKRRSDGGPDAASWTFSAVTGGTPGGINFTPPPAPTSSRVISLNTPWKYNNSGNDPGAQWKNAAYNDTGAPWLTGESMFGFGGAQLFQPGISVAPGGIWDQSVWTADSDSRISTARMYTHKIGLNHPGAFPAINGVVFDSPGPNIKSGAGWSLTGADYAFTNNGSGAGANNLQNPSGSRQLCTEFFYGANDNGKSRLTLSGLTVGQPYITRIYATGFGGPGDRLTRIVPSDSGVAFLCDENATNSGNGIIISYRYKAPPGGTMAFDFIPVASANTWHHYAFSNEAAATATSEIEVSGASVAAFSSQLVSGYTRGAVNTVNGSGLTSAMHGTIPDGSMWLSNGTFAAPTDPLPAEITWDLGASTDLTSLHVWNYNEGAPDLTARGSRLVEILTAATAGGPFTSRGTWTLFKASARATEPGQHIEIEVANVRQVRFNITANHGGDNAFTGLSEVKFFKAGSPGPATPSAYREPIATLFNTGVGNNRLPVAPGQPDPHYTNQSGAAPVISMSPHPAWLQDDGVSRFIGLTGAGVDTVPAGTLTYRTTADFAGYDPASTTVRVFVAVDNSLDVLRLNGNVVSGVTGSGFASYLGPFTIPGPFIQGLNTFDFQWTNAGPDPNPGGLRIKWDATSSPSFTRTTLAANPTTTWFRKAFTLTGNPASTYTGALVHAVDDGAVFYINGTEVARFNITGTPLPTTNADVDIQFPMFSSSISIPPGLLQAGSNVLAVELHQAASGSADALFGATLDVTETPAAISSASLKVDKVSSAAAGVFTLDLRNDTLVALNLQGYAVHSSSGQQFSLTGTLAAGAWLTLDQAALGFRPIDGDKLYLLGPAGFVLDGVVVKNKAQARTTSATWLTPASLNAGAQAVFSVPDSIVINEIMYHHHPDYLATGTTDNPEEWVELTNRSGGTVSLAGWKLRGGVSFDFTTQSIAPGAFLVIARNPAALAVKYPAISITGPWTGSLSNKSDLVRLEDPADNAADEVRYYAGGRWDGRADGGGSSLELRDADADNSSPESWAASDESAKSYWQTYSWNGLAAPFPGTNDPTVYNEFILGLINAGECLVDDVNVTTGATPLIQNGTFASGNANTWRLLGNHGSHGRSIVQDDPSSPGSKVLRIAATGPAEHMHNHCETTLKNGAAFHTINSGLNYAVSFRARWISGCPRLHSRLYFNRLARQVLLPIPANTGTPGAPNSRAAANIGPSISGLAHLPVLPAGSQSVTIRATIKDPDAVGTVSLKYRDANTAPAFAALTMIPSASGLYEGVIPGQPPGTLMEFFIEATDALTAVSRYPADSALIKWNDGTVPPGPGHGFRLLMTRANSDFMHLATNVMSNDTLPATVIYKDSEVFYDARLRLKSSQRGRLGDVRLGFVAVFDPVQLFRGKISAVNFDRSSYGRGTPDSGYGQSEIWNWHFFQRAGGIPSMYNDLVYLISPRSAHTGSSTLTMAEFNDPYLDGQWTNGADTPTFKYELIYYPTTTEGGGPEGLKIPNPDLVNAVNFNGITSSDKEAYRWNFLIGNDRSDDDYSRIQNMASVMRMTGAGFLENLPAAIDVDQWLRCFAAFSLAGIGDHYTSSAGGWHNLKLYNRSDGRILFLPWDHDFNNLGFDAAIAVAPDLLKMLNASPAWHRAFYGHLHDIISKSFNTEYVTPWMPHYQSFTTTGGNWGQITSYVTARAAYVTSQCNALYPTLAFAITTNDGIDFTSPDPQTSLAGNAWINVHRLRLRGSNEPLPVTWITRTAWQVSLPLLSGPNVFVVDGLDFSGNVVASDTITVTGTGGVIAASATNIVVSELHYNPGAPTSAEISAGFTDNDDFEFIELTNISSHTVDLSGVRFTAGLGWNAAGGTRIPPSGRVVIPRRASAFALRYPGVTVTGEYYAADGNQLDNGGEEIALADAGGADIKRFIYDDRTPWPVSPDSTGPSLVLVAPGLNPDHADPLSWRASAGTGGNPGGSDGTTLPANPNGDDNNSGLTNLVDYATGGNLPVVTFTGSAITIVLRRTAGSDVIPSVETASDLQVWTEAGLSLLSRVPDGSGGEILTLAFLAPAGPGSRLFARVKFRAAY